MELILNPKPKNQSWGGEYHYTVGNDTVDGWNPAVTSWGWQCIFLFTRFYTSQAVQDFFHQQYLDKWLSFLNLNSIYCNGNFGGILYHRYHARGDQPPGKGRYNLPLAYPILISLMVEMFCSSRFHLWTSPRSNQNFTPKSKVLAIFMRATEKKKNGRILSMKYWFFGEWWGSFIHVLWHNPTRIGWDFIPDIYPTNNQGPIYHCSCQPETLISIAQSWFWSWSPTSQAPWTSWFLFLALTSYLCTNKRNTSGGNLMNL